MPRTVTVDDARILALFEETEEPIRTVPDMAEELSLGSDALRRRLKRLEESGEVKSKQVGARSVVWWRLD
ncbi:hypothetical protein GCM10009030_16440 [Haloarcula pellucida]|uniref:Uncharacterized protein n=1 Tax=Haloarcula pellucida TaxID=1427151 RepID=A0A830GLV0_9EURY|nr:hypothetical protein GCM10009030_16440 [Halomicroarcula pellucida]